MKRNKLFAGMAIVVVVAIAFCAWYMMHPSKVSQIDQRLVACGSLPNNSTQHVLDTSRMFINIPKDLYPDVNLQIASHGATAGSVSNGGPYGNAVGAQGKPDCWSYYFEFDGVGTVDLSSKSATSAVPDYAVHFIVSGATSTQPQVTGTLKGTMTIGPICPVEQAGHPCNPTPQMYAAHQVFIYTSDKSKLIATLTPGAEGNFSTTLPAGSYLVDVQHQSIGSVKGAPSTIMIVANQAAEVSIDIDTGIR